MSRNIPLLAKAWSPVSRYLGAACGMGSVLNAAQSIRGRPAHCKYRNSLTHTRCWIIPTRCEWTYAKSLACALGTSIAIHVLNALTITIMHFKIQDWTSYITYDRRTVVNNYNMKLQQKIENLIPHNTIRLQRKIKMHKTTNTWHSLTGFLGKHKNTFILPCDCK